jgi:tetratricopeptide (TPR) repeat protein
MKKSGVFIIALLTAVSAAPLENSFFDDRGYNQRQRDLQWQQGYELGEQLFYSLFTQQTRSPAERAEDAYKRGNDYYSKKNYDKAIEEFTGAIELVPDKAAYYVQRASAYYQKSDYDRVIADCTRGLQLEPDNTSAYSWRGPAYYKKGEWDPAIADCTQWIRLKPDSAAAYSWRGSSYEGKGEWDPAIADYTAWIRLVPDNGYAYSSRGAVYKEKGEWDLAIADYTEAIVKAPNTASYYAGRGSVYKLRGDRALLFSGGHYKKARADYQRALQLNPNNEAALTLLEELENTRRGFPLPVVAVLAAALAAAAWFFLARKGAPLASVFTAVSVLTCPSCRAKLPAANVNQSTGIALCAACGEVFRLAELTPAPARAPLPKQLKPVFVCVPAVVAVAALLFFVIGRNGGTSPQTAPPASVPQSGGGRAVSAETPVPVPAALESAEYSGAMVQGNTTLNIRLVLGGFADGQVINTYYLYTTQNIPIPLSGGFSEGKLSLLENADSGFVFPHFDSAYQAVTGTWTGPSGKYEVTLTRK